MAASAVGSASSCAHQRGRGAFDGRRQRAMVSRRASPKRLCVLKMPAAIFTSLPTWPMRTTALHPALRAGAQHVADEIARLDDGRLRGAQMLARRLFAEAAGCQV